jgi:hypothetical protein
MHVLITRAGNALTLDGVNTYIWNLASALSNIGFEVTVCGGCGNGMLEAQHYVKTYFGIDFKGNYMALRSNSQNALFTWSVKGPSLIRELKPDLVHVNGVVPLLSNTPKIATYHGMLNFDTVVSRHKLVLNTIYDRVMYRGFKRILAVSHTKPRKSS